MNDIELAQAHYEMGMEHLQQGLVYPALEKCNEALKLDQKLMPAYVARGLIYYQLKEYDKALVDYNSALSIDLNQVEVYCNRGMIYQDRKDFSLAENDYKMAINVNPDFYGSYFNLGTLYLEQHRLEEAIEQFQKVIYLDQLFFKAYFNCGIALLDLERYSEAEEAFTSSIQINPRFADGWYGLGNALHKQGRYNEAIFNFNTAISIHPFYAKAYWNKGHSLLLTGDFEQGWKLNEWRWQANNLPKYGKAVSKPVWLGEYSVKGKTVLVHSEQGLGDIIQFSRYIKLVKDLGATVIFELPRELHLVLNNIPGADKLVTTSGETPDYDYHIPLMSLPLAFKTDASNIPFATSYIQADKSKSLEWQSRIDHSRVNIGLVWEGSEKSGMYVNQRRNIPTSIISKLLDVSLLPIDFYSLQKDTTNQLTDDNVFNFTKELHDFSDTAALIDNLDLVITVDSSVAHLAGAMGKRVWLLNRFDTDWRWFNDHSSPWYQSMTIYKQITPGDWDSVITRVKDDLVKFLVDRPTTICVT